MVVPTASTATLAGWKLRIKQMCFSVINSTMTPSRRRAQDCPRPLVLPHGCVCPPAFYSVALTRRSGGTTVCLLRAPAACAGLCTAANRGQSAGRLLPPLQSLWHLQMRHPRRRESRRWPAVALWSSCDLWAAARGPGGAQPSSPRGTDTRQEHIRWWFADSSAKSTTKQAPARAPMCARRRAQCGPRERPCRAAPALAVPT